MVTASLIELPTLYPHQEEMRDAIRKSLSKHKRSILCAPPGTGKTRMAKWIMGSYANRPKSEGQSGFSLFVVHRRGLVDNASHSFRESPELPHGVIMSGRDTDFGHSVHVASIDTIKSWYVEVDNYTGHTFDLIVYDECHNHVPALRSFLGPHDAKREIDNLKQSFVMGINATETKWFQRLAAVSSVICFPTGRVNFWHPERESAPLQGQAALYADNAAVQSFESKITKILKACPELPRDEAVRRIASECFVADDE